MTNFDLSDEAVMGLLKLQALYAGRNGNYSRIEDKVDMLRYRVVDRVMTEIMLQIEGHQNQLKLK